MQIKKIVCPRCQADLEITTSVAIVGTSLRWSHKMMEGIPKTILETPLHELYLSVKCERIVESLGIKTIGQLIEIPETILSSRKKIGKKTAREIKNAIGAYLKTYAIRTYFNDSK